jgi:Cd2+/Zn2+-exporting ATPase
MKATRKAPQQQRDSAPLPRATARFAAPDIDCPSCAAGIRSGLKVLPGIQAVAVNVAGREVAVTFDPRQLDAPAIRARLEAIGFRCQ